LDEAGIHQPADEMEAELPDSDPEMVTENADDTLDGAGDPSLLMLLMGIGLLFAVAMAAPFLAGFENIIGLVIIAFGLYQAWKMNKRNPVVITGPFKLDISDGSIIEGSVNG
jgi:hypothetical protein